MSRAAERAVEGTHPPPELAPGPVTAVTAVSGAPKRSGRAPWASRTVHLLVLVLCLGAILGAAVLEPAGAGTAASGTSAASAASADALALGGVTVPEVCALKRTTGVPCPGCGLTRSWVSALDGRWRGSFGHHPLGWLFLLYAGVQALRHAAWLGLPGRRAAIERLGRPLDRALLGLAALLIVVWLPTLGQALGRL